MGRVGRCTRGNRPGQKSRRLHQSMTRGRRSGDRELREAAAPGEGDRRDRSLSEAQASGGMNGPLRSAMAFIYFYIAGTKDFLHVRAFQIRATVSSESPSASDTMRQPETSLPLGRTPTLRSISMLNWICMSRASWA